MIAIDEHEIVDYGIDHCQYFQGAGTAFTKWDHVYLGAGSNAYEALEDALEQASWQYDLDAVVNPFDAGEDEEEWLHADDCVYNPNYEEPEDEEEDDNSGECYCELFHYVAIYFTEAVEEEVAV